jgi:hypothetical protein
MSVNLCGDQTDEQKSRIGKIYVLYAKMSNEIPLDSKDLNIR